MNQQTEWNFTYNDGPTSISGTFETGDTPVSTEKDYWYEVTSVSGTVNVDGDIYTIGGAGSLSPDNTISQNWVSQTNGFQIKDSFQFYTTTTTGLGPSTWNIHAGRIPGLYQMSREGVAPNDAGIDILGSFSATPTSPLPSDPNPVINPPCFCAGTYIRTINGDIAVEDLVIGDQVLTLNGKTKPITWIGSRKDHASHYPEKERNGFWPIRFKANSLGFHSPTEDLLVSPLHGMFVDGVRICAFLLVNGSTILQEKSNNYVEYFHVELSDHSIIYSNNAPSESYFEFDNFHCRFDNSGTYPLAQKQLEGRTHCCPMIWEGKELDRIKNRLLRKFSEAV